MRRFTLRLVCSLISTSCQPHKVTSRRIVVVALLYFVMNNQFRCFKMWGFVWLFPFLFTDGGRICPVIYWVILRIHLIVYSLSTLRLSRNLIHSIFGEWRIDFFNDFVVVVVVTDFFFKVLRSVIRSFVYFDEFICSIHLEIYQSQHKSFSFF